MTHKRINVLKLFGICTFLLVGLVNLGTGQAFQIKQDAKAASGKLGVNANFVDNDRISQTLSSVFWFGELDATQNHIDIRVAYNTNELQFFASVFDRELFFDEAAVESRFDQYDTVSIYLKPKGSSQTFLFKSQLFNAKDQLDYRIAYRDSGSGFVRDDSISFTGPTNDFPNLVWYGESLNNESTDPRDQDRGWYTRFNIPFSEIGMPTPETGDVWEIAIVGHDRDDAAGNVVNSQIWPPTAAVTDTASWGELRFGRTADDSPFATQTGSISLRHGVNGVDIIDAQVGGGTNCGIDYDPDFFNGWATHNFNGDAQINVQNQMNTEDWPCFSKILISVPVSSIPAFKEIISAELTMFQFGNAGGGAFDPAVGSNLQIMTVDSGFDEATVNWINSPSVVEHIDEVWVDPINNANNFANPPIPVTWDVKSAVKQAIADGERMNLVIYSADWALHSGKYFYSSDANDVDHRPLVNITYGDAEAPSNFVYLPLTVR
ncbi:MAG: DNRLRE domain-containing protein [Chloroflexota bacterium]